MLLNAARRSRPYALGAGAGLTGIYVAEQEESAIEMMPVLAVMAHDSLHQNMIRPVCDFVSEIMPVGSENRNTFFVHQSSPEVQFCEAVASLAAVLKIDSGRLQMLRLRNEASDDCQKTPQTVKKLQSIVQIAADHGYQLMPEDVKHLAATLELCPAENCEELLSIATDRFDKLLREHHEHNSLKAKEAQSVKIIDIDVEDRRAISAALSSVYWRCESRPSAIFQRYAHNEMGYSAIVGLAANSWYGTKKTISFIVSPLRHVDKVLSPMVEHPLISATVLTTLLAGSAVSYRLAIDPAFGDASALMMKNGTIEAYNKAQEAGKYVLPGLTSVAAGAGQKGKKYIVDPTYEWVVVPTGDYIVTPTVNGATKAGASVGWVCRSAYLRLWYTAHCLKKSNSEIDFETWWHRVETDAELST